MVERIRNFGVAQLSPSGRSAKSDAVVVEEPLEIRLEDAALAVVMRTPGHDLELTAGLLVAEEILLDPSDIGTLAHCEDPEDPEAHNIVNLRFAPAADPGVRQRQKAERSLLTSASCGVCGKRSIESLQHSVGAFDGPAPVIERALVSALPGRMRKAQDVFESTGGLHAAAVFDPSGALLLSREDVGRHNAVDKCVGGLFLDERLPLTDAILCVSGRVSFEIVQKALVARIRSIVAVSAPSSLAIELSRASGMNLFAFARGDSVNVYAGETS